MSIVVVVCYLGALLVIGWLSARRGQATAEDYFLAGRSFGTVVLFMALFGTNVTAFAMLGIPGLAYKKGISVFGFFGAPAAFFGPLLFVLLGYPIWRAGKRHGYVTPVQMVRDRWQSPAVGYLVMGLLLFYTVPYVVVGIMGGGIAIAKLSGDAIPYATAACLVSVTTVLYTSAGGMRGTAWTNVFQATCFMVFLTVAVVCLAGELGGLRALHGRMASEQPHLFEQAFPPGVWATGFLIGPVSIIAFPHMLMRLLAAKDERALGRTVHLYPWALMLLFGTVTLIGCWGAVVMPGLAYQDDVLPKLVAQYLPWLAPFALAAILAAVMSSLDGQLLTVATLISVDGFDAADDSRVRRWGRMVVVVTAGVALGIALLRPDAIFGISKYAFSGYTLVVPILGATFFAPRVTKHAVLIASAVGHVILAVHYLPWTRDALPTFGMVPVASCLLLELFLMGAVSAKTAPASSAALAKFADPFGRGARPKSAGL